MKRRPYLLNTLLGNTAIIGSEPMYSSAMASAIQTPQRCESVSNNLHPSIIVHTVKLILYCVWKICWKKIISLSIAVLGLHFYTQI